MRRTTFGLIIGLLLIEVWAWAQKPLPPPSGFPYAYAHHDCAPWDGQALRIVLQKVKSASSAGGIRFADMAFPHYAISVWMHQPPVNRWIDLKGGSSVDQNGVLSWCPAHMQCTQPPARVKFSSVTGQEVTGTLQVDGRLIRFQAPLIPNRALCG